MRLPTSFHQRDDFGQEMKTKTESCEATDGNWVTMSFQLLAFSNPLVPFTCNYRLNGMEADYRPPQLLKPSFKNICILKFPIPEICNFVSVSLFVQFVWISSICFTIRLYCFKIRFRDFHYYNVWFSLIVSFNTKFWNWIYFKQTWF